MGRKLPNLTIPNPIRPTGTRKLAEFDLMSRNGHDYRFYRSERVRLNGNTGTLFFGDNPPAENLPAMYSNVVILSSRSEYAPEQTSSVVFVADRGMN